MTTLTAYEMNPAEDTRDHPRGAPVMTTRDLSPYVDSYGNISVAVEIKAGAGTPAAEDRLTGANHVPAAVAVFLRHLADEVEAAGKRLNGNQS